MSITNNQGTLPQRAINITVLITVLFWFPLTVLAATSTLNDYNPYNVNIPDNGSSVNSDLALSGAPSGATITKVKVYYEIRHTYIGDLKVWLTTYYDGAWHDFVLKNREGGSTDNIIETRDNLTTWNGASPNQTWYLVAQDMATGDTGYIDFFELWVTYSVNDPPNTPSSEDPSDGATGVSINKDLDWSCSDPNSDTLYYTVYFEKNDSSPDNVIKSDATGSAADPGTLDYDAHYYWQVKADDHKGGVSWSPIWNFHTASNPFGDLVVTVKNVGGNSVSGATVKRYDASWNYIDQKVTDGSGNANWNSISTGIYNLEAYYMGTFFGQEYWASDSATVSGGSTTNKILQRNYPYVEDVVLKNHATGATLTPSSEVDPGTTVRAEITVRNKVPASLGVRVRMLFDRGQSSPYDSDQTSSEQEISSNGTKTYILTYTPTQTGTWYRAVEVKTRLANGNTVTTDAWGWTQAFVVYSLPNVALISAEFSKERYRKDEVVSATIGLQNKDPMVLDNVHLFIDFKDPSGNYVAGFESDSFSIPALSTYYTSSMLLWQVPLSAYSGAYEPRIRLLSSSDQQIASFMSGENPQIPILAIGDFPVLKNVIVRSQEHFNDNNPDSVSVVLQEFVNRNLMSISLSLKLDDGDGMWAALSPVPGQVLFNSSVASPKAQNPLTYDLYREAQSVSQSLGININPWIPIFFDHAQSRFDHPEWKLLNDPPSAPNQDFVDAHIEAVRSYEGGLITEVVSSSYASPNRVTLDHFRYTNGQHGAEGALSIATFVQEVKGSIPSGTELAGYIWLPSDTWWSGQDYTLLNAYLDVFSPMLYWQDHKISSADETPYSARQYVINKVTEIKNVLGSTITEGKVMPTLSITTSVDFSDGGSSNLDAYEWKKTQLNVLGAVADEGLLGYDLFYHGKWLWFVYPENTEKGKWIDWAQYLAGLALEYGSLSVTISPQGAIDAGAQWRRVGTATWRNSGYTESGIPVGQYSVKFKDISGWTKPSNKTVTIDPSQTTTASGTYTEIQPEIFVSPSNIDFGLVEVGSSTYESFTVENTSYGTLEGSASVSLPFSIHSGGSYSLTHGQTQAVTVRFSPASAQSYSENVTFTGADGTTKPVSGEGVTTIVAPVIGSISDELIEDGSPYIGPTPILTAGTQPVTWSLVTGPSGMSINSSTGVVSWANPTVSGSPHTVTIRATNSAGYDDESWQLTVTLSPIPPVINPISDDSTVEGSPYTGPTPSLSQGTLPVTWTLVTGPSGMSINSSTGVVSWQNPTAIGSPHEITIRATNTVGYDDETWQLTVIANDTTPPTPSPMTWATEPYATGQTSIRMVATTASDVSGVEYYFQETSGNPGGNDSGWQASPEYENTGLNPGTAYSYRVKARDKSPNHNETTYSVLRSATTQTSAVTRIAVVNPDTYRILKMGALNDSGNFYSIASGSIADGKDFTDPADWTGVGEQQDFISTILTNAGYEVDQFEASVLPSISNADYQVVIVQDPLRTNVRSFSKESEHNLPDLLEYTTDATFLAKLEAYFGSGGQVIFIGDAVRLLEDGPGRLNWGKSVIDRSVFNNPSQDDPRLADHWLFIRGNPFCGIDRNGSGQYLVHLSTLVNSGTVLSDITLFNGNDLPWSSCWSDTFYYPEDGTSLLSVDVTGTGEYVLSGATCNPPVYNDTVNETLLHLIGYTHHNGKKVFYIGSDSFFDYHYVNNEGAWHAGEYHSIQCSVTEAGKEAIVRLVQNATERKTKAMPWLHLLLFDE